MVSEYQLEQYTRDELANDYFDLPNSSSYRTPNTKEPIPEYTMLEDEDGVLEIIRKTVELREKMKEQKKSKEATTRAR